jgi:hypothetical protein
MRQQFAEIVFVDEKIEKTVDETVDENVDEMCSWMIFL